MPPGATRMELSLGTSLHDSGKVQDPPWDRGPSDTGKEVATLAGISKGTRGAEAWTPGLEVNHIQEACGKNPWKQRDFRERL